MRSQLQGVSAVLALSESKQQSSIFITHITLTSLQQEKREQSLLYFTFLITLPKCDTSTGQTDEKLDILKTCVCQSYNLSKIVKEFNANQCNISRQIPNFIPTSCHTVQCLLICSSGARTNCHYGRNFMKKFQRITNSNIFWV